MHTIVALWPIRHVTPKGEGLFQKMHTTTCLSWIWSSRCCWYDPPRQLADSKEFWICNSTTSGRSVSAEMKLGLWGNTIERGFTHLNFGVGEDCWEGHGQPRQAMGRQTDKSRVLTQGMNDQAQIVLHYVKTSGEGSDARKGGKKGKEKMRWMDSSYSDDRATIGRYSWRHPSGENLCTWSLRVNTNYMAFSQSHMKSNFCFLSVNFLCWNKM